MEKNLKIRKAVIPAAGLGTRFLPFTKSQPKEMLPIVDKPAIQFIVEEAVNSGIDNIIIITGRNKRSLEDHFDYSIELETFLKKCGKQDLLGIVQDISNLADIHYIRQKQALGLGHAIYTARKFIGNEPFAVLLGDDIIYSKIPCIQQMIKVYETYGSPVLGVQKVSREEVNKYGVVDGEFKNDRIYRARNLIEKPNPEDSPATSLAIMGRYIISPEIFDILETLAPGKSGEIQLTDGLRELSKMRELLAYDFEGRRYDVGDKFGFLQANIEYGLRSEEFSDTLLQYLQKLVFSPN
jgi:UTP--glucose-1-phosphate uridylyltransferase